MSQLASSAPAVRLIRLVSSPREVASARTSASNCAANSVPPMSKPEPSAAAGAAPVGSVRWAAWASVRLS